MTKDSMERAGKRHASADAALVVTTITLAVSLVIAATAVSIGIARADTLVPVVTRDMSGRVAMAILLGIVVLVIRVLTAAALRDGKPPPPRY